METLERLAGIGAPTAETGVAVRVRAPHAESVHVTGRFNDWSVDADALKRDARGSCCGHVAMARVGDEYRFGIGAPKGKPGRIDPYARTMTNSAGNAIVTDLAPAADDRFIHPAWSERVIYELDIGTFGTAGETEAGSFEAAIARLDHLKALGVNAIEIMPAAGFAGDVSWGYNPAHVFTVESAYDGPEGLDRLVSAARDFGFAVILDVVCSLLGPPTSGASTAGANATRAGSPSTKTGAPPRPGARPGPIMAARRSAGSSATTPSTGSKPTGSTGCGSS